MALEKGLRFNLLLLKRYNLHLNRYIENRKIRKVYLAENDIDKILSFASAHDMDPDRFYYIYWKKAEQLYELKKYEAASNYFTLAIDNVITDSYNKNKSKFKSEHYNLLLENYHKAMDCLFKSNKYWELDYYTELNMYSPTGEPETCEEKGDFFLRHEQKELAIKYYEKELVNISWRPIVRKYAYDPYYDDALKTEYEEKIEEQKKDENRVLEKIEKAKN